MPDEILLARISLVCMGLLLILAVLLVMSAHVFFGILLAIVCIRTAVLCLRVLRAGH